jgi:tRNA-binding protein
MVTIEDFEKIDIRVGKIIDVQDFPEARNPAFKLLIDFGDEIGVKKSSAQLVGAHTKESLLSELVLCVVNFPPRQVGPFMSEVLTLGLDNAKGEGYFVVSPVSDDIELGSRLG